MMKQIFGSHKFHFGEGCTWADFLGVTTLPPKKNKQKYNPQELLAPSKKRLETSPPL